MTWGGNVDEEQYLREELDKARAALKAEQDAHQRTSEELQNKIEDLRREVEEAWDKKKPVRESEIPLSSLEAYLMRLELNQNPHFEYMELLHACQRAGSEVAGRLILGAKTFEQMQLDFK
jgi:hypothetical protein